MTYLPTPGAVLDYWFGAATDDALVAAMKNKLWFQKSFATDQYISDRFLPLMTALASGLAHEWAASAPRARLAAIIVLDQFSRNLFRGNALAFAHDKLARGLCKEGLVLGEDAGLSEVEKMFFYIPLEHSEYLPDQDLSVSQYQKLARSSRPAFKPLVDDTLLYAVKHRDVIREFGRFPHRNTILKRASTEPEQAHLARPGSGF